MALCGDPCGPPPPSPVNAMRVPGNGPNQSSRVSATRWGPSAPGFLERISSKMLLLTHADYSQMLIKMCRRREVTLSAHPGLQLRVRESGTRSVCVGLFRVSRR